MSTAETLTTIADGRPDLPVSVVIPAYGRPQWLRRAVLSALEQTRPPREVIVVDDASPEPLESAISDLGDRVRVIRCELNAGPGAARNRGWEAASENWIAFLDDDDQWLPAKLARQADLAREGTVVITDYEISAEGSVSRVRIPTEALASPALCNVICPSSALVHRSDLARVGGFSTRRDCAEDWVFFASLIASRIEILAIDEPLVVYSWSSESTTASHRIRISHIRGAVEQMVADHTFSSGQRSAIRACGLGRIAEIEANDGQVRAALSTAAGAIRESPSAGLRVVPRGSLSYARGVVRRVLSRGDGRARGFTLRRDRLSPYPSQADYIQLRALHVQMRNRIEQAWPIGAGISVADIGCGDRPYEPLFAERADRYVGVDVFDGPKVDVVAVGEDLPFENGSFDCALATGVIQLVPDPEAVVAELHRILAPGGTLFLSAHGIGFADRQSVDRWRWTQYGLGDLFTSVGTWKKAEVLPAGGVLGAAAYLIGGQAEFAAHHAGLAPLAAPVCLALNAAAVNGDRLVRRRFPEYPPDASVNYLVAATKAHSG